MQSEHYYKQLEKLTSTMSINQLTQKELLNLDIPIVSEEKSKNIIQEVEIYEKEIEKAKQIMDSCFARKQAVLDKYLNS